VSDDSVTRITIFPACAAALLFVRASEHNLRRIANQLDESGTMT
jgi:hypothetical protein